ncbi:MAG: NYN domain-containing protein, partial [Myxococcales bacterium]|nr:NYN domain-containing protein [Myxococcales bacterium]
MSRFSDQRVAVLVDTAYVYHAARSFFRGRVDYKRLLDFVADGRALVRAIAFVVRHEDADVSAFVEALRAVGFEVRVKSVRRRADGQARGDWSVGLALTAAALAPRVDVVALVGGDGDLVDLVDHLMVQGVRTEVCGFAAATAQALVEAAEGFRALDADLLLAEPGESTRREPGEAPSAARREPEG